MPILVGLTLLCSTLAVQSKDKISAWSDVIANSNSASKCKENKSSRTHCNKCIVPTKRNKTQKQQYRFYYSKFKSKILVKELLQSIVVVWLNRIILTISTLLYSYPQKFLLSNLQIGFNICSQIFLYLMNGQEFLGEFEHQSYIINKLYLDSAIDNVRLYHTRFTPKNPTRTIAIIHGFGQHSGRFYEVAHFFATRQFQVLLIDFTGFGYSGGPRGCSTVEMMQNDVITLLGQARPQLPLFIYAHSMGGLITIKLLLQKSELRISGCIITSPFLGLPSDRHFPKAKLWVVQKLGDDLEDLIINAMINPTALTKNNKKLHNIFQDRLMIPFLSAKMAKSLFDAVDWVKKHMSKFNYPVILFHGKKDSILSYQYSKMFIEQKISPYRKLHLFEKGYHQLQHDEEKEEMLNAAVNFVDSLPGTMIREIGRVVYNDWAIKLKPKEHPMRNVARFLVIIGVLVFIYKRFLKK